MHRTRWIGWVILVILLVAIIVPITLTGNAEIERADAARLAGEYDKAAGSYALAAHLLPWRRDLWERAGEAALLAGQPDRTIAFLSHDKQPSQTGYLLLGQAYMRRGDLEAALASFESAREFYGPAPEVSAGLADVYLQRQDWPAARRALQDQVQLDVSDPGAHYRLGVLLVVLEPDQAVSELMLASSLDPEFDPAAQTLIAALNLSAVQPDSSRQMVTNGRGLGLVQEWVLSAAAFAKAIELDAQNAEAWAWLGEAKQQLGQDGRGELDRALSLDSRSATVRALRGLYWNRQSKYPQVLAEYLLAAEYEPGNPIWQASIGDAYARLGDLPAALAAYQKASGLAPDDPTYFRLLAVFCAQNGVHVEQVGLPAAQKAAELAPADPITLDVLGWTYLASGRYFTAEQILQDVITRAPEYLPARLHLAMTFLAQGKHDAAYVELVHIRDADPQGADGLFAAQLLTQYFP